MARLVWITGAAGLIGRALVKAVARHAPQWQARGLTRQDLDLCDHGAVKNLFQQERPGAIIHCAAQSRTGLCEQDPQAARQINVEATRNLASLAAEIPFLFFSTDLVFDGKKGNYTEHDPVNPISRYGETKVEAEQVVLINPRHTVIRTSLNFGFSAQGGRAFNEEWLSRWGKGECISLFTDEFRSPIPVQATAQAVWELLNGGHRGIFHLAGMGKLSRWEIGQVLGELWPSYKSLMLPVSLKDFTGPPRAADTSLNCTQINALLPTPLPCFPEWIRQHTAEILTAGGRHG